MCVKGALRDVPHFAITCEEGVHEGAGVFTEPSKHWPRVARELDPELYERRVPVPLGEAPGLLPHTGSRAGNGNAGRGASFPATRRHRDTL